MAGGLDGRAAAAGPSEELPGRPAQRPREPPKHRAVAEGSSERPAREPVEGKKGPNDRDKQSKAEPVLITLRDGKRMRTPLESTGNEIGLLCRIVHPT